MYMDILVRLGELLYQTTLVSLFIASFASFVGLVCWLIAAPFVGFVAATFLVPAIVVTAVMMLIVVLPSFDWNSLDRVVIGSGADTDSEPDTRRG